MLFGGCTTTLRRISHSTRLHSNTCIHVMFTSASRCKYTELLVTRLLATGRNRLNSNSVNELEINCHKASRGHELAIFLTTAAGALKYAEHFLGVPQIDIHFFRTMLASKMVAALPSCTCMISLMRLYLSGPCSAISPAGSQRPSSSGNCSFAICYVMSVNKRTKLSTKLLTYYIHAYIYMLSFTLLRRTALRRYGATTTVMLLKKILHFCGRRSEPEA